jgi:hypothetical protein
MTGQADELDRDAEHDDRQESNKNLDAELDEGAHRPAVVDDQEPGRKAGHQQQARGIAVVRQEDEHRCRKPDVHGEAAQQRGWVGVRVAATGFGDQSGAVRQANRERHDERADRERDQQRPQAGKQVIAQADQRAAAEEVSQKTAQSNE